MNRAHRGHVGGHEGNASQRRLMAAGWFFAFGSAVHVIDHLRRGQGSVSEELFWAGNLALVLQVVVVTLIFTRHRLAPPVAAVVGLALSAGFGAAHWLPEWSAMSDPVWEIESARQFSYLASSLEILGALAVAVAGLAVIRRQGLPSPSLEQPRPGGIESGPRSL
jgi:hypothetical protein